MKHYVIDVDITVSKRIYLDAENEEKAKAILKKNMEYPHYYYTKADAFVGYEVTDINEEDPEPEEERTTLDNALDYVREQLDEDELVFYRAEVSRNLNHRIPANMGLDDGKIIDLLEEYGEDNDMPEGWWEEYGDIDDWLLKL